MLKVLVSLVYTNIFIQDYTLEKYILIGVLSYWLVMVKTIYTVWETSSRAKSLANHEILTANLEIPKQTHLTGGKIRAFDYVRQVF